MDRSPQHDASLHEHARAIVETVSEPLLVLDADLRVLMTNRSFCETFQVTPEETENRLLSDLGNGQWNLPPLRSMLADVAGSSTELDGFEVTQEFENIGRRTMLLSARRLQEEGDRPPRISSIADLTGRREIQHALEVSEARYRRLFETAQDGILLLDAHTGEILDINPFLVEMLGYSYDDVVGMKLWEIGPFKDVEAAQSAFEELQRAKYIRYEDLPLETKDGRKMDVEFVSNVYPVDGEEIIQCNIRDITARKHAEDALHELHLELETRVEERTAELAQATEALRREIGERERAEETLRTVVLEERTRMSREIHDTLAQGLTGIVIQLEAAEDALAEELEAARAHVLQARQLARDSLAEARRSVWALRPQALESRDLAGALLHLVNQPAIEAATHVEFLLQGTVRPLATEVEHNLLRIGQEALTNALKHAQAARIRVTLTFSSEYVELSVEDDGQGTEPVAQPGPGGSGLRSLAERAERIGGRLTIESHARKGTRVVVVVPLPAAPA